MDWKLRALKKPGLVARLPSPSLKGDSVVVSLPRCGQRGVKPPLEPTTLKTPLPS